MSRASHVEALLSPEVYRKVRETRVLVVGAGGIGCELLKNLVLVGFANIEIVDLDTIDLSNLNRQFLFRKPDISKPKALVAAATARHFNPSSGIEIHARHGNVKEPSNDVEWIKNFGLVMNALDNADARRHVNKLCQAAGVQMIESGTAGYMGQVSPIIPNQTECFECQVKPAPKSFPVCTIRATPSEPIHCIVWAKSYLFGKLFGEDDEAVDAEELDKAKADGENAEEIENLRKEAAAFREVRRNLGEEDGPQRVFEKVFHEDISRLLAMDDLWNKPGRVKPVPLHRQSISDGTFPTPPLRSAAAPVTSTATANGSTSGPINANGTNGDSSTLRDQRELSLKDNLDLFIDSCRRLSARAIAHPEVILSFDKDDDDTLDFVLATANLRATAYGIANKTRFQVKEMAGNIIPAIATTNAVIAGLLVMQAIHLLSGREKEARNVFLRSEPTRPIWKYPINPPNPACAVCRDVYIPLKVDLAKCTLGEFVLNVVDKWLKQGLDQAGSEDESDDPEWTISDGPRVLADPDFDDNHSRTLEDLGMERGKMLTVTDWDEKYHPIHFCICVPDDNATSTYTLPTQPPSIPLRPPKPVPRAPSPDDDIEHVDATEAAKTTIPISSGSSLKRPAPDDGDVSIGNDVGKKRKADNDSNGTGESQGRKKVKEVQVDSDDDFEIL